MYLLFASLEQAQAAQSQIDSNIVAIIAANEPEVVSDTGIIGLNAATGKLDYEAARTITWCEPVECVEGWYLFKPEISHSYFDGVDVLAGLGEYQECDRITPLAPLSPEPMDQEPPIDDKP